MLQLARKMFSFQRRDVEFFVLLGPLFLILALFLTSFHNLPNKDLFLTSFVGVFLCWKSGKRGLIVSLLFLVILALIKHFQISSHHVWQFGLEASIGLGFFISYYAFEYAKEFLASLGVEEKKVLEKSKKLEEELQKEEDFHQRQHKNFKDEMDQMNIKLEEKESEISSYKNLVEDLRKSVEESKKENLLKIEEREKEKEREIENIKRELLKKGESVDENVLEGNKELQKNLEILEKEKKQSYAINQSLSKMLSKETNLRKELQKEIESLKALENEKRDEGEEKDKGDEALKAEALEKKEAFANYEKKFLQLKNIESLYKQLKNQFEEKKRILDRTRRDLFHEKEKLVAIKLENDRKVYDQPEEVRELQRELASFEKEIVKYEEENTQLQELITELTKKLNRENIKDVEEKLEKKIAPEVPLNESI